MKIHHIAAFLVVFAMAATACGAGGSRETATRGGEDRAIEDGYGDAPAPTPKRPGTDVRASIRTATTKFGSILVDGAGRTLYAFTDDTAGTSTCKTTCAAVWPPVLTTDVSLSAPQRASATVSTVPGPAGGSQVKVGRWPVYLFAGDAVPGDVNGQGSGGVWFVLRPDGSLVRELTVS